MRGAKKLMLYTNDAIKRRNEKIRKINNLKTIIIYIILVPILFYNISIIIQSIAKSDKTPSFFGIKTYIVISGSMKPYLNIGDIVVAKETKEDSLKDGDIICFRQGQSVVTHRISEIFEENNEKRYKTKGDNNNAEDSGSISYKLIEGKVVTKIPFVGKLILFIQRKIVIILLIILFYIYIIKLNNKKRKQEERKNKRREYERKNFSNN